MSENPEFDNALKDMLGDAVEYLNCSNCKAELKHCPNCSEMICPNFCEESSDNEVNQNKLKGGNQDDRRIRKYEAD